MTYGKVIILLGTILSNLICCRWVSHKSHKDISQRDRYHSHQRTNKNIKDVPSKAVRKKCCHIVSDVQTRC